MTLHIVTYFLKLVSLKGSKLALLISRDMTVGRLVHVTEAAFLIPQKSFFQHRESNLFFERMIADGRLVQTALLQDIISSRHL